MDSMPCVRANLRRLRTRQALSQSEVAERAGLDANYYQKIESGRWKSLRLVTVEKLAEALGVEMWEMFVPPSQK